MKTRFVCLMSLALAACASEEPEVDTLRGVADGGSSGSGAESGTSGAGGECGCKDGAQGEPGEKGDKGDRGETGPRGAKGEPGELGEKGDQGAQGETGATGAQGLQGVKGVKGDKGANGSTGAQGIQGVAGLKGDIGPKGDKGDAGPKGEPGEPGEDGADGSVKKSQLYTVKLEAGVGKAGLVSAMARCTDASDVLLSGTCEFYPTSWSPMDVDWSVTSHGAWHQTSTTETSGWMCGAYLRTGNTGFEVTSTAVCLISDR